MDLEPISRKEYNMSTRCQIKIKDSEDNIFIYKHWDGYPKKVIPILKPFVDKFIKERGQDDAYLLAQIIRHFAIEEYKSGELSEFTGWGLDCDQHGDIEYLYEVDGQTGDIYINGKKLS